MLVRYNVYIKVKNIGYILQLKQFFAFKYNNIDFNIIIIFYIEIVITSKYKINLIKFLESKKVKLIKIIANINKKATI